MNVYGEEFGTQIPQEVISAAHLVMKFVRSVTPNLHNVRICGVEARVFLSVKTMLDDQDVNIYFTELK